MVIFITGASRGIGKAITEIFAADTLGHTIVMVAKQAAHLQKTAAAIQQQFPAAKVLHYACNLTDKRAMDDMNTWLQTQVKAVDVLINNAGYFIPGSVHSETEGTLEEMLQVNLLSAYHLTRALLPAMMQRKSGHIFNMCSIASQQAYANGGSYSISKFALLGFGKNLRQELMPHGIKVTNVMPGAVWTDSWSGSGIPPERIMEAKDIAQLVYAAANLSLQACVEEIIVRPQEGDL